jgi:hypothetical protein
MGILLILKSAEREHHLPATAGRAYFVNDRFKVYHLKTPPDKTFENRHPTICSNKKLQVIATRQIDIFRKNLFIKVPAKNWLVLHLAGRP